MGKQFETIPADIQSWIREQHLFFVASAPLDGRGSVNVSPKGAADTFHLVDERSCFYVDLTGSGTETIAHIYEPGNARLTIMFTAFEGPPQIVRLFGKGSVYERGTAEYERRTADLDLHPGTRAIIWLDIDAVTTACGFSVPLMDYVKDRPVLDDFMRKLEDFDADDRPEKGMSMYWHKKNSVSIDGLPGIGTRIGRAFPGEQQIDKILYHHQRNGTTLSTTGKSRPWLPSWAPGVPIGIALTLLVLRVMQALP